MIKRDLNMPMLLPRYSYVTVFVRQFVFLFLIKIVLVNKKLKMLKLQSRL